MVPQSWISESLEMFGIAKNVQDFLNNSMEVRAERTRGKIKKSWYQERDFSGRWLISVVVYFVCGPIDMVVENS